MDDNIPPAFAFPSFDETNRWLPSITTSTNPTKSPLPAFSPSDPRDLEALSRFSSNNGNYRNPSYPLARITKGIDPGMVETITNDPDHHRILVVMNGGKQCRLKVCQYLLNICEYLLTVREYLLNICAYLLNILNIHNCLLNI